MTFERLNKTKDQVEVDVRVNWSDEDVRGAYWLTFGDADGWFEELIRSVYQERKLK